jgi:hypothetical protein
VINCADSPWQFQNRSGKVAPERRRHDRYATITFSTPATSLILLDSRMPAPSLSEIRPRSNFQWAGAGQGDAVILGDENASLQG